MDVMEHITAALFLCLANHEETMKPVFQEKRVLDPIYDFCQNHKSLWLEAEDLDVIKGVLVLCSECALLGILSDDDLLKWQHLVLAALAKHFTYSAIEIYAFFFIEHVSNTVNHRELEKTSLVTTLVTIVQSDDSSSQMKMKYREIIKTVLS
jgi:hypothetical protein